MEHGVEGMPEVKGSEPCSRNREKGVGLPMKSLHLTSIGGQRIKYLVAPYGSDGQVR